MDLDVYGGGTKAVMSLNESAISGIKWSSLSHIVQQAIQLVTAVILARLLSPSDFGLMSMAIVVTGFIALFKDLGTSAAVIQHKNLSETLLSTAYWVHVVVGFLSTTLLILISALAGSLYREPGLVALVRVLSVTFFISGLGILPQTLLERELAFQKLIKIEVSAIAFGSIVGIGSALLGAGVWSLVYQSLAVAAASTVFLWISSSWRPRMVFQWSEMKSICGYSLNLTGFNIFNYFARNADYILIGRFLGTRDLGYYTLAYRLMLYPLQSISGAIGRVMFPAYSQMQNDDAKFQRVFLNVAGSVALITFPMMLGLMALSEPFVLTFFGPQWVPVTLLLMILAPVGLIQSVGTTVGAIYQAKGRTDWMLRWGIGAGLLVMLAFVIGLRWGIVGVAIAYALVSVILTYPNFAIPFRLINLPVRDLGAVLWRPFLSGLLMLAVVLALKGALPTDLPSGLALGILVLTGIVTYFSAGWMVDRNHMRQILGMVGVRT